MANFVWLRRGDVLPSVAVAQLLLRRAGHSIAADGIFGPRTQAAVRAFQRPRGLKPDGVIGIKTWPRLRAETRLPILDCIDVFDFTNFARKVMPLTMIGADPILIGGMSNGIEQAVSEIRQRAGGDLFLLRFWGHGAPGLAGVSTGHGKLGDHRSILRPGDPSRKALAKLKGIFGHWGCIEFMHCSTAKGPKGREFLTMVAQAAEVPATAAIRTQYSDGTLRLTMRFEGPTRTFCPGGQSLKAWAGSRRAFPGMTVA